MNHKREKHVWNKIDQNLYETEGSNPFTRTALDLGSKRAVQFGLTVIFMVLLNFSGCLKTLNRCVYLAVLALVYV